ncbi:HlyD family secretion protein [Erwinia tracheiphila]|uniref:Anibiotic ABC transporter n=1 Tax=Erwinia tracheiphila TaxID=65700 RepID=A0A0M2KIJ1_9GAMM|nr:HlyD family efflux transporter periplasmic adaptor subunit [Erwinia tracheiphila]AXF77993.1 HlyD family efflux transporter periplasmic adaptor subunit [Erwinia tracheiphila]KKF37132.1 anibiotic ABC transporter [Erwinia tracheiphila]UIA83293.1 HlyD family secretion protein [Erwinia tracheiphila]UIA88514.1 HlyD family secretion protein [Erwinia tracheiphila]UIA91872.1 HlyD family secretion protein [Erwinia tracheiphila]
MSEKLFRDEALEANRSKAIGKVALYCPPWRWVNISLVVLVTLIVVLFCIFGSYTKRETAKGSLRPVEGMMNIMAVNSGTVTDINMVEGQSVKKGDILATVSSEITTQLGSTRVMIAEQLEQQLTGLMRERKNLDTLNLETIRGLEEKKTLLLQQIDQLKRMKSQRTLQINLARGQVKKLQLMRDKGFASATQVEQQQSTLLDAQARLLDVERQRIDVQQKLTQTEQQLREQPVNFQSKKNDIERQLASVQQSRVENESRRSIRLEAPDDAIVGSVLVKPGQIVTAGQSVASLLPENAELQARIMLSSRSIGFIKPGQRVVLRYEAYPSQKFGPQFGTVVGVSRVSLSPQEVSHLTGDMQVQESFYQVRVKLDNQFVSAYGHNEKLPPGGALEADFITDKRRVYQWVLEPLYALGRQASL